MYPSSPHATPVHTTPHLQIKSGHFIALDVICHAVCSMSRKPNSSERKFLNTLEQRWPQLMTHVQYTVIRTHVFITNLYVALGKPSECASSGINSCCGAGRRGQDSRTNHLHRLIFHEVGVMPLSPFVSHRACAAS